MSVFALQYSDLTCLRMSASSDRSFVTICPKYVMLLVAARHLVGWSPLTIDVHWQLQTDHNLLLILEIASLRTECSQKDLDCWQG